MPTGPWLTNSGVVCITGEAVTYSELAEMIGANNQLFYDIQGVVHGRKRTSQ
jgi:hypothetical protein